MGTSCTVQHLPTNHITDAKEIGAELIANDPAGYGEYRLQCGHEGVFGHAHVRDKNINSQTCKDEELAFRAMYVGLILNFGKGRNQ